VDPDCGPECQETLREIERFLDGELETGMRAMVDKHLSGCDPCTQRTAFRIHLKAMISSSCRRDAMPAELLARVQSLLQAEPPPPG
jgi:mycothiol system anti-sigma-R factor